MPSHRHQRDPISEEDLCFASSAGVGCIDFSKRQQPVTLGDDLISLSLVAIEATD